MAGAWAPPRDVDAEDRGGAPADEVTRLLRRARFQPLLLVGSAVTVLPLVVTSGAPAWAVGTVLVLLLVGAAAWLWARSRPLGRAGRQALSLAMTVFGVVGLVVVLAGTGWSPVEDLLLLIAAFGAVVAIAPDRRVAWLFQLSIVLVLVVALTAAGRPAPVTGLIAVQVAAIMLVADTFAQRLLGIRMAEQAARRAAERRGELLTAVRALPRGSVHDAEQAAVDTLRTLAFDTAAVVRLEGDELWERVVAGAPALGGPVERGRGLAWRAILEDRTLTTDRYDADTDGLPGRESLRGAVAAPVRVDGRPIGALAGGRPAARRPNDDEVEIVEVMAAHLGAVMANRATVRRQHELLERAGRLDQLGRGLLTAVSEELRQPLHTLRATVGTLLDRGTDLSPDQRDGLLRQLRTESEELRLVLDTILDFSRFHARRADPQIAPTSLDRLLEGAGIDTVAAGATTDTDPAGRDDTGRPGRGVPERLGQGATARPGRGVPERLTVLADPELAVPALSLLVASGQRDRRQRPTLALVRAARGGEVGLALPRDRAVHGPNVLLQVAAQLLVAAGGRLADDEIDGGITVWFRITAPEPTAVGTPGGQHR